MQVALFRIALGPDTRRLLCNEDVPTQKDAEGNTVSMGDQKVKTLQLMMKNAVMGETNDTYEVLFQKTTKFTHEYPHQKADVGDKAKGAKRQCLFCGRWHQFTPGKCPAQG